MKQNIFVNSILKLNLYDYHSFQQKKLYLYKYQNIGKFPFILLNSKSYEIALLNKK